MARVNRAGLIGTMPRRRVDGTVIEGTSDNVFVHITSLYNKLDDQIVYINFGVWASKAEYKAGLAEVEGFGNILKQYKIDRNLTVQDGRDIYTADGLTNSFAFTKANNGEAFILVRIGSKNMTLGVDYTVSYTSGSSGAGNVIFTTPPASGASIKLIRLSPAYLKYFAPNKTMAADKDTFTQAVAFLLTLDGADTWDELKIDFTGYTQDSIA